MDETVVVWRAGRSYVAGPLVITALLLGSLAVGVVSRSGWLIGGLLALGLTAGGLAWSWALHRMCLILTRDQVIVQNVVYRTTFARSEVLAVAPERDGVQIWYRTADGPAAITASGTQAILAGDFRRSRTAQIVEELKQELDVDAPSSWLRRNAHYD